jgi:transcriptional regulator with XRE-family HTH domain
MIPIGEILHKLRSEKGLSLRRMGKEVGISFNTLNAYERNAIHPTLESCYKLSRYFDVPMEYFIFGEKVTQELRDAELKALFQEVDALKAPDRRVVKSYIRKFLNTRKQMNDLISQAEEDTREDLESIRPDRDTGKS